MLDKIFEILYQQWLWDLSNMSQPWMYYWLLIPIFFYTLFFMCKWSILTAPIWLPLHGIIKGFPIKLNIKKDK